ncbi:MAG: META domain-containing protein [Chloroflexota bacterium]|nr:MAG: META domain-containing protein [Chloroflexota bacterium]
MRKSTNLVMHRTKIRFISVLGFSISLALFVAACGGVEPAPPTQPPEITEAAVIPSPTEVPPTPHPVIDPQQVTDQIWVLVGFGDAANPQVVQQGTVITLFLSPEGEISGSSGCNNYSSSYELSPDGNIQILSPFAATMMYCAQGMEQETTYLAALQGAEFVQLSPDGRLEIIYDSGKTYEEKLIFAEGSTPLVGTHWLLVSYGEVSSPSIVGPGTAITVIFSEDGNVSGSSGCNYYAGSYEATDNQMSIGPLATTGQICPEFVDLESAYMAALSSVSGYQLFGKSLSISYNDGQDSLNFTSANLPLEGTLWTLISVNGESLPEGISITAVFESAVGEEPATVAGSAGCNSYSAGYQVAEGTLSIDTPIATRKFCDVGMESETAYLSAIEGENSFEILGNSLDLSTDEGRTLTFVADRTPLVGALWMLVSLGDVDQPQEPVAGSSFTAQFSRNPNTPSGVVAGTTGCNEYSAAYASNLEEIKINLPQKTRNENCAPGLFEQEQQFFLAMNDATTYQILGNVLFLPYDDGNQLLVFAGTQTELAGKRPLSELDGTEWFLHYLNAEPILPGTLMDARFTVNPDESAGRISGSAGCNSYNAVFTQELGVEASLSSASRCYKPDGVMEQETDYLNALDRSYGYWLTGDQLVINTGLGALTFRETPPDSVKDQTHLLQNVKWYLINYNVQPSVAGNAEPFVFFNLDQTFFGNTGCNELSGEYSTEVEEITIQNVSVGNLSCPDETSSKQERVILTNLEAAQNFVVADTGMQISSDRGTLYYSSVPVQRPEPSEPPTANITGPEEASVGEIVRFDGSRSSSEIGITNYSWDYGDGNQASGPVVEKIYLNPGDYQVTLVVVDKFGQRGSATAGITIISQPAEQVPPTAEISGPGEGFVAEPVTFSAENSVAGSSPITTFSWDFGNGAIAPESPNTSVTTLYDAPGTYLVTVTATDANGLSSSDSLQITVDTRLEGPVWSLLDVLPKTAITLQFLEGEFTGFSGCNTYSGQYEALDNGDGTYQVEIIEIITTRLLCADEIMEQETEYLTAIEELSSASIDGNLLTLVSGDTLLYYYEVGTPKPEQIPE